MEITENITDLQTEISIFLNDLKKENIGEQLQSQLTDVGESLTKSENPWIDVDINRIFNPALFIEINQNIYREKNRWIKFIDVIRNVLILLPIALTWYALFQASAAYHRMVGVDPTLAAQPFLMQWENGFNGNLPATPLLGTLTFSHIALIDFWIIFFILLLTFGVHMWGNLLDERNERKLVRFADRLNIILYRLNLTFGAQKKLFLQNSEQRSIELLISIKEFIDEFKRQGFDYQNLIAAEQERLTTQADLRQQELAYIIAFSDVFRQSTESLAVLTPAISTPLTNLDNTISLLTTETGQIQAINSRLLDSIQAFEGYMISFENVVKTLSQDLSTSAAEISDTANVYGGKLGEIVEVIDELSNLIKDISEGQIRLQEALIAEKTTAESWVSEIRRSSADIQGSTSKIGVYTDQLSTYGIALDTLSQQNSDLTRQLKVVQTAMETLLSPLNNVDRITSQLTTALLPASQNMQVLSQNLGGLSGQFDNLGHAMNKINGISGAMGVYSDQIKSFSEELVRTNHHGEKIEEMYRGLIFEQSELRKHISSDQTQVKETIDSIASAINKIDTFVKKLDAYLALQQKTTDTGVRLGDEMVRLRNTIENISIEPSPVQKPGNIWDRIRGR